MLTIISYYSGDFFCYSTDKGTFMIALSPTPADSVPNNYRS